MMNLDSWVKDMEFWYQSRKHDQVELLEPLILNTPKQVWGPTINTVQSKAIACWLDACLRVFERNRYSACDKAFQYLQLAYSKLQQVASNPLSETELKDWALKRIQHLIVLTLEFCNQQSSGEWQRQSNQLIEAHIHFMAANDHEMNQGSIDHNPTRSRAMH
ncbi:transcriptional regulator [uncultured Vibrio sp.]|uniref:transcriptional regulator n=1 Tax=uncultured Vibrio sp. TaxID=114054 RepID=UPI0025DEE128|nr:transcriptional regulator [uncultured Vibrio sp.]